MITLKSHCIKQQRSHNINWTCDDGW